MPKLVIHNIGDLVVLYSREYPEANGTFGIVTRRYKLGNCYSYDVLWFNNTYDLSAQGWNVSIRRMGE